MFADVCGGDALEDICDLLGGYHGDEEARVNPSDAGDHGVGAGGFRGCSTRGAGLDEVVTPDQEGAEEAGFGLLAGWVNAGVGVAVCAPRGGLCDGAKLGPAPPGEVVFVEGAFWDTLVTEVADGVENVLEGAGGAVVERGRGRSWRAEVAVGAVATLLGESWRGKTGPAYRGWGWTLGTG